MEKSNPVDSKDSFPYPFTLAIDDSDTPWGGCTTHLAWLLLRELSYYIILGDYPLLVRLNPVVPRKTRGNAAVVIRGYSRVPQEELLEKAISLAESYSRRRPPGKGPGIALYRDVDAWRVPLLRRLYLRALRTYIPRDTIDEIARRLDLEVTGGSGVVGATASLAALAPWDPYTYELIAYRREEYMDRERCVERNPGLASEESLCSFANYDLLQGKLASSPGGPDPVLAGFRGRDPSCLGKLSSLLCEEPAGWVLYRSNQHTGMPGEGPGSLNPRPYNYVRLKGVVKALPRESPGGHVFVDLETGWGDVTVAFYRETGPLRDAARMLRPGDVIVVEGGVIPRSKGPTLAVDVMYVEKLAGKIHYVAPRCPRCGSRMKSMGRGKGYRCRKCGFRDPSASPIPIVSPRRLMSGRYTPSVSSARHLTRFNWWSPSTGFEPQALRVDCVASYGPEPPLLAYGRSSC